jgi:hypothetical protein
MHAASDIIEYHNGLEPAELAICETLQSAIAQALPTAEGMVWHGHPVWFLNGNPVVGYSRKKAGIELLFWSGQSFEQAGLKPVGKFKAASAAFVDASAIEAMALAAWLHQAEAIQWDYANLAKKRVLEKLTAF